MALHWWGVVHPYAAWPPLLAAFVLGGFLSLFTQVMWLGNKCGDSTVVVGLGVCREKMQSKGESSRKLKEIF